jgi:hypothetical protein
MRRRILENTRIIKHEHGTPNQIIAEEEKELLSAVDKALSSSSNSQTIGRNGEIPLRLFFGRYLPYTLRAVTGHFVPPSGHLSPQIDVMILDARYPLLAENSDGSVLAMLHSVVHTIEVKTRITSSNIDSAWRSAVETISLASEVPIYGSNRFGAIGTSVFAYRSANRLDTIEKRYTETGTPEHASLDFYILRLSENDQSNSNSVGVELHFEPVFESQRSDKVTGYSPTCRASFTPLSDLYYRIVQDSYYCLGARNHSFTDIGRHVMSYLSWATCDWNEYFAKKRNGARRNRTGETG